MAKYIKYKGQKILVDYAKSDALGNEINIANLQTKLTITQQQAVDSGINATKVQNYDNYATNKQDTLHSGTNIKTINGQSILGSGDLEISGGSSGSVKVLDITEESFQVIDNPSGSVPITDTNKVSLINEMLQNVGGLGEENPTSAYFIKYAYGLSSIQLSVSMAADSLSVEFYCPIIKTDTNNPSSLKVYNGKFLFTPNSQEETFPTAYTLTLKYIEAPEGNAGNNLIYLSTDSTGSQINPLTDAQKQILNEFGNQYISKNSPKTLTICLQAGFFLYFSSNIMISPFEGKMYVDFYNNVNDSIPGIRLIITCEGDNETISFDNATISIEKLDIYQEKLVSGTNIKTINGESLLGSGNISVDGYTDLGLISGTPSQLATQVYNALYYDTGAVKSAIVLCETEGTFDEDGIIGSGNVVFTSCGDVQMLAISSKGIALLDTNGKATELGYENFVNLRELSLSGGTLLPISLTSLNSNFTNRKLFNIVGSINDNSFVASNAYLIGDTYYIEIPSSNKTYYTVVINSTNGVYTINQYQYATISEIPTNVSDLTNDANYITSSALNNYYDKETIDNLFSQLKKASMQVVSELPATGEEGIIYLVGASSPYEQYIWENGAYIDLGSTAVDLTGYVKGTGLTADRIILGNGNSNIKTSSYSISNSSSTSTTILLTAKAINDLINSKGFATTTALNQGLEAKQEKLVSGTNIKTINGQSLLGTGNIAIQEITITNNNDDTYTFTWGE